MRRLLRIPRAVAAAIGAMIEPLRPDPGTTEAGLYFGLLLLAAGFVHAQLIGSLIWAPLAFVVPGAIITFISAAPVLAGLRKSA